MSEREPGALHERGESLWILVIGPAVWAAHFLLCYAVAAIWCARIAGPDGPLGGARVAMASFTLVALVGIAIVGRRGWRMHGSGTAAVPHDFDTREDRRRFLGFATLLLSGLSAVAVVYVALAAVFVETCR